MEDQSRDDAAYLKSLRQTAGLDLAELAALANLSAGQIRQLEDGGNPCFIPRKSRPSHCAGLFTCWKALSPAASPSKYSL
ncbi:MAG: hypothetical protein EBQ84_08615 [Betaproteobacteria bacterium]|nr:hypothetical protein [Betaproteobacteria bacterium]